MPAFDAAGNLTHVVEKPTEPPSDYAVICIYLYDKTFLTLSSKSNHRHAASMITDVNTWMLQNGKSVGWEEITGWWKDTGTPEAILEGNASILSDLSHDTFVVEGAVDPTARLQGMVQVVKELLLVRDV